METQLLIGNEAAAPVALLTDQSSIEADLQKRVDELLEKIAALEERILGMSDSQGLSQKQAMISRMTSLHNQNEFMSNLLTMFIKVVQWPKVTSKQVDQWTSTARSMGSRGKDLVGFLDKFNLGLRDLEKYQKALENNGHGGVHEG